MVPSPTTRARKPPTRPSVEHDPYRSFAHFDADSATLADITREFERWLHKKRNWAVDLSQLGRHADEKRSLTYIRHPLDNGELLRFRLTESNSGPGTWTTELSAYSPSSDGVGWFLLQVSSSLAHWVQVPRLAEDLIDLLAIRPDDSQSLTPKPALITSHSVEELAARITDPNRYGLIFVAGTDANIDFDPFFKRVGKWAQQVVGQAEVAVLDPLATVALRSALGNEHAVSPWTIRTFMPGVDPAEPGNHLQHRYVGISTLAGLSDNALNRMFGRIARRHAARQRPPTDILRHLRTLDRVENKQALESLLPKRTSDLGPTRPPIVPATDQPVEPLLTESADVPATPAEAPPTVDQHADSVAQRSLRLVMDVLGLTSISRTELEEIRQRADENTAPAFLQGAEEIVSQKQAEIELLTDTVAELRVQVENWQLEAAEEQERRQQLADETRSLRNRLREAQAFEAANAPTSDSELTAYPNDYHELVAMLRGTEDFGVVFTGDADECLSLADHDPLCTAARVCWEAVLALQDYVRARVAGAWTAGVHDYLIRPPEGYRAVPVGKHRRGESNATMQQWGNQRRFPVPPEVARGGRVEMTAHFKIGSFGTISPRMYYLDRWSSNGKIYIGYIGRHLKNTLTN